MFDTEVPAPGDTILRINRHGLQLSTELRKRLQRRHWQRDEQLPVLATKFEGGE